MKKFSLLIAVLSLAFTINSCAKKEVIENVGIKINNQTDYNFESIELNVYSGTDKESIDFDNINANSTSPYKFIDNLDYSQYDYSIKDVYFVSEGYAYISGEKYQYNIGFCGTGLIPKTTDNLNFTINILQIDLENHYLFCEEVITD